MILQTGLQAVVIRYIENVSDFMGIYILLFQMILMQSYKQLKLSSNFLSDGIECLCMCSFGRMVACFRYAPIHIYSVYLPPSNIVCNYDKQEWIQKESDKVWLFRLSPNAILGFFVYILIG